jgi:hypothetical protein
MATLAGIHSVLSYICNIYFFNFEEAGEGGEGLGSGEWRVESVKGLDKRQEIASLRSQ